MDDGIPFSFQFWILVSCAFSCARLLKIFWAFSSLMNVLSRFPDSPISLSHFLFGPSTTKAFLPQWWSIMARFLNSSLKSKSLNKSWIHFPSSFRKFDLSTPEDGPRYTTFTLKSSNSSFFPFKLWLYHLGPIRNNYHPATSPWATMTKCISRKNNRIVVHLRI